MKKTLAYTCYILPGLFILIIAELFVPAVREIFRGTIFLIPFMLFFLLGIGLIIETKRTKQEGKLRRALLITGFSSVGILISILLHNAFYAAGKIAQNIVILKYLFEVLSIIFFITAIIICPLAFLAGIIMVLSIRFSSRIHRAQEKCN
ncbi:hypothetical protein ACFLTD_03290 [Elusimicrobiota bacterium]